VIKVRIDTEEVLMVNLCKCSSEGNKKNSIMSQPMLSNLALTETNSRHDAVELALSLIKSECIIRYNIY